VGIFQFNTWIALLSSVSMVLSAVYSVWLYNRLMFGQSRVNALLLFVDVTRKEFYMICPLVFFTFLFGVWPIPILNSITLSLNNYMWIY
jgi:NADH-quinone oxidoreductase subunit M